MSDHQLVFVGTYTRREPHVEGKSEGIYVYRLDVSTGALTHLSTMAGIDNPSYVELHPNGRFLYAAIEVGDYGGQSSGAVSAFSIDAEAGQLTLLNHEPSHGSAPCHVTVDATGSYVLSANYTGGSVCVHPINADGSLSPSSCFIQHEGSSINPQRQGEAHAHSINMDKQNRRAFVADLGMDKVMIYELNMQSGELTPNDPPWASVTPGQGPRHFDFHPSGQYAYLINELGSTVTVFGYDKASGALTELQNISTLPADFDGRSHCADIHVHPSGRFVYGSNRGHDSIACYSIDEATGLLTLIGFESTQGKVPRNFAIDPTGQILLAANQNSHNIVTYHIDQENGVLTPTGQQVSAPTPVCLKLLEV